MTMAFLEDADVLPPSVYQAIASFAPAETRKYEDSKVSDKLPETGYVASGTLRRYAIQGGQLSKGVDGVASSEQAAYDAAKAQRGQHLLYDGGGFLVAASFRPEA